MGLFDQAASMMGDGAVKGMVSQLTGAASHEVEQQATSSIQESTEGAAKQKLTALAQSVLEQQIHKLPDPGGIVSSHKDAIIKQAVPQVVDQVWARVKAKLVKP